MSKTLEQSVRAHLYTLQVCAFCEAYFSDRKMKKTEQMCICGRGIPSGRCAYPKKMMKGDLKL